MNAFCNMIMLENSLFSPISYEKQDLKEIVIKKQGKTF